MLARPNTLWQPLLAIASPLLPLALLLQPPLGCRRSMSLFMAEVQITCLCSLFVPDTLQEKAASRDSGRGMQQPAKALAMAVFSFCLFFSAKAEAESIRMCSFLFAGQGPRKIRLPAGIATAADAGGRRCRRCRRRRCCCCCSAAVAVAIAAGAGSGAGRTPALLNCQCLRRGKPSRSLGMPCIFAVAVAAAVLLLVQQLLFL